MATQVISLYGTVTLVDNMSGPLQRVTNQARGMGGIIKSSLLVATVAVTGLGVASVKAATSFESAFTGVKKTVDATEQEFDRLRQGILTMAKDATNPVAGLPGAQNALAGIMEQAGQLGVRGVDNLLKFTEVVAKLGLATNLGSDAAIKLAQFMNITGEKHENIDRLGASIVALGNNLATTENDVLQMATRIAGAGTVAGLTSQEILALAGAASSLGLRAEMGGSAISRIFNQMAESVGKGGDELEAFAQTAGLSTAAFSELFKTDALEAFRKVVLGLGGTESTAQANALDEMGLSGIRVSDALRRLALDFGGVKEAIDLANTSYDENNALNVEAERRLQTTAAQWNVLKNTIRDVFITIGDRLLPTVNSLMGAIQGFLVDEGFTGWLDNTLDSAGRLANRFGELADTIRSQLPSALGEVGRAFSDIQHFLLGDFLTDAPTVFDLLPDIMGPGELRGLGDIFDLSDPRLGDMFDLPDIAGAGERAGLGDIFGGADENAAPTQGFIGKLIDKFNELKDTILPVIIDGFSTFKNDILPATVELASQLIAHFNTFKSDILPAIVDFVQPRLVTAFNVLKDDVIPTIIKHFNTFKNETLPAILDWVKPKLVGAFNDIKKVWVEDLQPAFVFVRDEVLPALVKIFETKLKPAFETIRDVWRDAILPALESAKTTLVEGVGPIVDTIVSTFNDLKDNVLPAIIAVIEDDWGPVLDELEGLFTRLFNIWENNIWPLLRDNIWPLFRDDILPILEDMAAILGLAIAGAVRLISFGLSRIALYSLQAANAILDISTWIVDILEDTGALDALWVGIETAVGLVADHVSIIKDGLGFIVEALNLLNSGDDLLTTGSATLDRLQGEGQAIARSGGFGYNDPGASGRILQAMLNDPQSAGARGTVNLGANITGNTRSFRDSGGSFQSGQSLIVGTGAQPEAFIPNFSGTAIPNIDKMGGKTMNITIGSIVADTEEGGRAAARGFSDELTQYAAQQGFLVTGLTG